MQNNHTTEWEKEFMKTNCGCSIIRPEIGTHSKEDCPLYTHHLEIEFISNLLSSSIQEEREKWEKEHDNGDCYYKVTDRITKKGKEIDIAINYLEKTKELLEKGEELIISALKDNTNI